MAWRRNDCGQFAPDPSATDLSRALARFRDKCEFEPRTGCVLWTGGTTRGRGTISTYGSFWYAGRRWFAHRWAAAFIHRLDVGSLQVGHTCPHTPDGHPNTLCVQHVAGQTQLENLAELNERMARVRAEQSNETRQFWLLVDRGYEPTPSAHDPASLGDMVPFFSPPDWLLTGASSAPIEADYCPF